MQRRQVLGTLAAGLLAGLAGGLPALALAAPDAKRTAIGAAWRGPKKDDPYFAGVLVADWEARALSIRYAIPLPTRPHGLVAEPGGGLLVAGFRPGGWLLRCDGDGRVVRRLDLDAESASVRLGGHALVAADGDRLVTTETDYATGRGTIGVRDRTTLKKLAEWDTHGIDPHQVVLDGAGHLIVANGGVARTLSDKKVDLHRMDASLVRLDSANGKLLRQWRLDDPRLSLRHLAWNRSPASPGALLGVAMQAEHDDPLVRTAAPVLAVLDGDRLHTPTRADDGAGYAGDIAAAAGGFVLSSNQRGIAQLWQPSTPERMAPVVRLEEAYALAPWGAPEAPGGNGFLVATGLGLGRWHPSEKPALLAWPQPMALENHWVAMAAA
jgi:hypothetical protein